MNEYKIVAPEDRDDLNTIEDIEEYFYSQEDQYKEEYEREIEEELFGIDNYIEAYKEEYAMEE